MNRLSLCLFALFFSGCTISLQSLEYRRALGFIATKRYESAVESLKKVIANDPNTELALKAAIGGAPIAHFDTKNYQAAVQFYKHIIYKTPEPEARKAAQKQIAQIYFENLHDYDQAILEFESLLRIKLPDDESFKYRLNIVKSHLQLNSVLQASSEVDALILQYPNIPDLYEAKVLKANILISNKNYAEAAVILESIIRAYPERAQKENLHLSLAVCYEDTKEFNRAIATLESMRSWYNHTDFLDIRIKRLKERSSNLPGAQGWKR